MAQGRGGATQATLAIGLVMLALLNGELAESKNFTVGGEQGWTYHVTNWTDGKTFHAGDILEFKYQKRVHVVLEVNSENYAQCTPENAMKAYFSGDDHITLRRGTQYFICGIGNHCSSAGMKIKVNAQ